jgi:hypothetical protein
MKFVSIGFNRELRMARDRFQEGFAAGWLTASQALIRAMPTAAAEAAPREMAGDLPIVRRRRGRPPKPATMAQPEKRRRGRPRKTEQT